MPRAVPAIAATVLLWDSVRAGPRRRPDARARATNDRGAGPDRGFQWADAAIGALAALGLVVAGAGATLVIRRDRS